MANKKALIALLIAAVLAFVFGRPSVEHRQGILFDSEPLKQDQQGQKPGQISTPRDMDFYRQLTIGSKIALQLGADNSDAVVEVVVTRVTQEESAVSIKGLAEAEGSMVMTIGEKFIHIFLSLDSGIYEYSGKDFQGVVSRTKDMRFKNDTAVLPNRSFELSDQPARRPLVPEVNRQ